MAPRRHPSGRPPPGTILVELTGPGPRDGQRCECTPHVLTVGLALPEIVTAPPTLYVDPWAARDLTFAQVIWEWDGTLIEDGVYRFRRR